jgi:hypothetical protein
MISEPPLGDEPPCASGPEAVGTRPQLIVSILKASRLVLPERQICRPQSSNFFHSYGQASTGLIEDLDDRPVITPNRSSSKRVGPMLRNAEKLVLQNTG